jgi:hypothetical protein
MTEIIKVQDGQDLVRIGSDGYSEFLTICNSIVSILWRTHYCYYAVQQSSINSDILKSSVLDIDLKDDKKVILEKIKNVLKLFENGTYKIELREIKKGQYQIAHDNTGMNESLDNSKGNFTFCTWTEGDILAFSQPFNEIDYDIVNGYKYKILENNKRPLIVTFNHELFGNDSFVIDGHHKLLAYNDLCIDAALVCITQIEPKIVNKIMSISAFNEIMNKSELKHYKRLIK